ncbi:MAG: hypothetical protein EZS28_030477, partial [Streblomastix strix]
MQNFLFIIESDIWFVNIFTVIQSNLCAASSVEDACLMEFVIVPLFPGVRI